MTILAMSAAVRLEISSIVSWTADLPTTEAPTCDAEPDRGYGFQVGVRTTSDVQLAVEEVEILVQPDGGRRGRTSRPPAQGPAAGGPR